MKMLRRFADNTKRTSYVNKLRRKRFRIFIELINEFDKPVTILDAGGTVNFWEQMGFAGNNDYRITIINISGETNKKYRNIDFIIADASDMNMIKDKEFDAVFSNSMIEHIERKKRKQAAKEIQRCGKMYFVQTPNYWFLIEPHFLFPCFQILPQKIKVFLLKKFNMGWFKKCRTDEEALQILKHNELLKRKELEELFPGGKIYKEKFFLFTKSFTITSKG